MPHMSLFVPCANRQAEQEGFVSGMAGIHNMDKYALPACLPACLPAKLCFQQLLLPVNSSAKVTICPFISNCTLRSFTFFSFANLPLSILIIRMILAALITTLLRFYSLLLLRSIGSCPTRPERARCTWKCTASSASSWGSRCGRGRRCRFASPASRTRKSSATPSPR